MSTPSLPADFVKRAAALAVSRFGVDQKRIGRALQAVLHAQADGISGDLLDMLVVQKLLTPSQAEELRLSLKDTHAATAAEMPALEEQPAALLESHTAPPEGARPAVPPTRSGYFLRNLGKYRLLRRLGEGGMGTVYLGYSEAEGRHVAIKVLADRLASNPTYVSRFLREARNGARLVHPHVVQFIEAGKDDASGKHYLVMEYVDGPSARTLLDRLGRLSIGDAVHLTLQIARALDYVHAHDFIHRDIKPDNILLDAAGVAKLADLGLAKCIADASQLTGQRQGFGTPYYMPCEQAIDATKADARSDIYALGATLYHLVTGVVPFPGETHLQIAERKLAGTYAPASSLNPDAAPLDTILEMMLARAPEDRYPHAAALIADLEGTGLDAPSSGIAETDADDCDAPDEGSQTAVQATQFDLAMASEPEAALDRAADDVWYVRYRERDGQWCSLRALTDHIAQRLRAHTLPVTAEGARTPTGTYQPLSTCPEFREVLARPSSRSVPAVSERNGHGTVAHVAPWDRGSGWILASMLLLAAVLALLHLLHIV